MKNQTNYQLSKIILGVAALVFLYMTWKAVGVVNHRYIGTEDGSYVNNTRESRELYDLAQRLTQHCETQKCQVQSVLDYATNIPYRVNEFKAHSPQQTIQMNFGDCDDKSNLLISLLHALNIESYFVLVPKHIFVIASVPEITDKKALYLDSRPFYILESTAANSKIGFPLKHRLDEIQAIIEPFENRKLDIEHLEWK